MMSELITNSLLFLITNLRKLNRVGSSKEEVLIDLRWGQPR